MPFNNQKGAKVLNKIIYYAKLFSCFERGEIMANIKSQIKRVGTNEKSRAENSSVKAAVRTEMKKVRLAVEAGELEKAEAALRVAVAKIDKSVSKGVQSKKTAARQKSHLQALVNGLKQ